MRKVVIMSGVSGSGKSTYAGKLMKEYIESTGLTFDQMMQLPEGNRRGTSTYCSADTFFVGADGIYTFDPTKLSLAHGECFRDFIRGVQAGCEMVVVDNTNTTDVEIAPYILGAQAFGYEAEILTLTPGHTMNWVDYYVRCAERNAHGVGIDTIKAQHKRLVNRRLPPWWKNTDISPSWITSEVG